MNRVHMISVMLDAERDGIPPALAREIPKKALTRRYANNPTLLKVTKHAAKMRELRHEP